MRIFSKYVIKEVVPPTLISLSIFTFVFLMRTIAELAERLIEHQYSLAEIGLLLLYSIPAILGYVIPMSILLGVIVGLNRLSSDSEVIALTSSGVSGHSYIFPLLGFAAVAWLANTWLLALAVPWANEAYGQIVIEHTSEVVASEVQPRVFNEDFPGFIIYVNEIDPRTKIWQRVFVFDSSDPRNPKATIAREAWLIQQNDSNTFDLYVRDFHSYTFPRDDLESPTQVARGGTSIFHLMESDIIDERMRQAKDNRSKTIQELLADIDRDENLVTFRTQLRNRSGSPQILDIYIDEAGEPVASATVEIPPTGGREMILDVPLRLGPGYEDRPLRLVLEHGGETVLEHGFSVADFASRRLTFALDANVELSPDLQLITPRVIRSKTNGYWIEIHKKFAIPFTCIIFVLLGMPLGLSYRRGGKAYGYVVGITLFVIYWGILSTGERLAIYERVSPALGIWAPNIIFGLLAVALLLRRRAELRVPGLGNFLYRLRTQEEQEEAGPKESLGVERRAERDADESKAHEPRLGRMIGFPQIVDRYIMKMFVMMFLLVFVVVYLVFSLVQFIDINNDIQKNNVDPAILVDYFIFNAPETTRWVIPISALMGTMIALGILSKNAEVLAFKSSGVSIYRLSVPVIVMALLVSTLSFYNLDSTIPATAQRLAEIKGIIRNRPVQTTRDPTNRWVLGADRNRIYYFHKYDEDRRELDELHLFEIEPDALSLRSRVYARQALWDGDEESWVSERGWSIDYSGIHSEAEEFTSPRALPMSESPAYFGQDVKPSDQMSFLELSEYIDTLSTYGFPTTREQFDLHWKISFPFLPLVMTLLGLPFAFGTAKRAGALTGIFISIGFVIVFWGMMSLFRALGQTGLLPAILAAWSPNIVFLGIGILLFATLRS